MSFTTVGEVGIGVGTLQRDVELLDSASSNFIKIEAALIAAAETTREEARTFLRL